MSNSTNTTSLGNSTQYYPPSAVCFTPDGGGSWDPSTYNQNNCSVTPDMIAFLNITSAISNYISVYCLNPPTDDSCPFGYCPNSDIAGPLVRIANYLTTLCISTLIFYAPKRVKDAFYSQLLTMYSLLITASISIMQQNLSRYHALMVSLIVCSPLSIYLMAYAIRAMWSGHHRLEPVLGKGQIFTRILVLLAGIFWAGLTIYTFVPHRLTSFAQSACKQPSFLAYSFLLAPIVAVLRAGKRAAWLSALILTPVLLVVIGWIIAILLRRSYIWPKGEPYRPKFGTVWRVVGEHFPFIHVVTVIILPFLYWVATIEIGVIDSNDNDFTLSFGQVLAVFVAIPPMIGVAKLAPDWYYWFMDLTWIRRMTGQSKMRRTSTDGESLLLGSERPTSIWTVDDDASTKYEPSIQEKVHDASRGKYEKLDG